MLSFNSRELTLPSGMIPYRFEKITMQNFGVKQLMLMSKAVATESWQPVIQALNSVIDVDVNLITDGDFYYLLACQRVEGYKISPLQAAWKCEGTVFRESGGLERTFTREQVRKIVKEYDEATDEERENLEDPETLTLISVQCNHHNANNLTLDDLYIVPLETKKLPEGLDFPRVDTLVDSLVARQDPENENVIQAARWIAQGETIDAKMDVLHEQKDLTLFESALQTEITVRHGISQVIVAKCTSCGQPAEHTFNIGPETFFDV